MRTILIGVDSGTQSTKALVVDANTGKVLGSGSAKYDLIPNLPPGEMRGVAVTRMGKSIYKDVLIERADPRGRAYYWIGGEPPTGEPTPGTDFGAIASGTVSVTPVQLDMTDNDFLDRLRGWDLSLHREILTKG